MGEPGVGREGLGPRLLGHVVAVARRQGVGQPRDVTPVLVDEVLAAVGDLQGLAVAGSVYGGVGVPACIATADAAAARVLDHVM